MAEKKNSSRSDQIEVIMQTRIYQNHEEFTSADMLDRLEKFKSTEHKINSRQRVDQLLVDMRAMGLIDKISNGVSVKYKKPASRILRQRWTSEKAEALCCGDYSRVIAGQAARDAERSASGFYRPSPASCGDIL